MIMLDETIGDTLCSLREAGLEDNTLFVMVSDNGGLSSQFPGVSGPYRGGKDSYLQGGIHNLGFVYGSSNLIPPERRGASYNGLVYIADWFPTFMALANGDPYSGPSNGNVVDGIDVFEALVNGNTSPRDEIFLNYDSSRGKGAIIVGDYKLLYGSGSSTQNPEVVFSLDGNTSYGSCFNISDNQGEFLVVRTSVSSCDDLGWTNAEARGLPDVCSASDFGNGCSGDVDWASAELFCSGVGARLCTSQELTSDETRATGCQGDNNLVWASTSCEGGYETAFGSSATSTAVTCSSTSEVHIARCCADVTVATPSPTQMSSLEPTSMPTFPQTSQPTATVVDAVSRSSCNDLGWTEEQSRGDPEV